MTLPAAWTQVPLGEVVDILDSQRVPVNAKDRAVRLGDVPYYGATGQVGWIDEALFNEELVLLGEDGAPFLDKSKPKAYMISGPSWVNNHAHVLRARSTTSNRFLLHALNATDFGPFVNGTTRLKLTQAAMCEIPVSLPPIAEQDRIVAAIEEQFSRLDASDSSLRSAATRLRPLPARIIDGALSGWPTKRLGELIREPLRNGHSAKRAAGGSIPVFTLTAVTARDFSERNTKLTGVEPGRVEGLWAEPGDIFVERSNTPELVGTAALYSGPSRFAIFPDLLIRVRVGPALLPEFAELALQSTRLRRYFQGRAKGIAGSMPKVDQAVILDAEIPMPSLETQARIVAEVDRDVSMAAELAASIGRALRRSDHLRRSILKQAFAGRLVPQDPSDEPASELMARFAAERPAPPRSRQRKRT